MLSQHFCENGPLSKQEKPWFIQMDIQFSLGSLGPEKTSVLIIAHVPEQTVGSCRLFSITHYSVPTLNHCPLLSASFLLRLYVIFIQLYSGIWDFSHTAAPQSLVCDKHVSWKYKLGLFRDTSPSKSLTACPCVLSFLAPWCASEWSGLDCIYIFLWTLWLSFPLDSVA